MRALIKTAPGAGHLEVLETTPPVPGPGEALVRIGPLGPVRDRPAALRRCVSRTEASGAVAADRRTRSRRAKSSSWDRAPVGPRRARASASRRSTGCGHCYHCVRGNYNLCQDWHHIGLTRAGVLAEFVVVPAASLLPLPDDVTLESAAFLEPLATAVHTLERVTPGARDHRPPSSARDRSGCCTCRCCGPPALGPVVMYGQTGRRGAARAGRRRSARARFSAIAAAIAAHAADATERHRIRPVDRIRRDERARFRRRSTSSAAAARSSASASCGTTEIDVLQVMRKDLTWIGVVASVRRHFAEAIRLDCTPGRSTRRT